MHAGDSGYSRDRTVHSYAGPLHEEWPGVCPGLFHYCTSHIWRTDRAASTNPESQGYEFGKLIPFIFYYLFYRVPMTPVLALPILFCKDFFFFIGDGFQNSGVVALPKGKTRHFFFTFFLLVVWYGPRVKSTHWWITMTCRRKRGWKGITTTTKNQHWVCGSDHRGFGPPCPWLSSPSHSLSCFFFGGMKKRHTDPSLAYTGTNTGHKHRAHRNKQDGRQSATERSCSLCLHLFASAQRSNQPNQRAK